MNRITKDFLKYLKNYIMEEILNHIVTHAPYIWSGDVLPQISYEILSRLREYTIFVFKPKLAEEYGITAETAFMKFNQMCQLIERYLPNNTCTANLHCLRC